MIIFSTSSSSSMGALRLAQEALYSAFEPRLS
jgi:hypothetical protein